MQIGIDARSLGPMRTGVGTYLSEILKRWPRDGNPKGIHLYSHRPIDFPTPNPFEFHIAHVRWGLPWYLFRSHKMIHSQDPDIFWGAQNLLPHKLSRHIPSIITIHDCVHRLGLAYAPSMLYNSLHRYFLPKAIRRSAKILAVSNFVADEIRRYHSVAPNQVEVTPLGVARSYFRDQIKIEEIPKIVERYQIQIPFILGVGTLEPRKNLKTLLQAFGQLPSNLQNKYQLVLVGKSGWRQSEFKRYLQTIPTVSRVRLTGYVPESDLPPLYASAEMFVFPSLYEGFGLPVLEAMAAGCPVISSNSSSLKEVVGSSGLVLNPHSPAEDWGKAMTRLALSSELRKDLRTRGLNQAKKFSWELCADRTVQIVASIARSGGGLP
jgi:glycosyltransferase involved in cell wall biosynthesis